MSDIDQDDSRDDDNDGVPDVQQIDAKDLVTRKTLLFLKVTLSYLSHFTFSQTVDPHRFTAAISGIQSGFLAVVAALKVQFAKVTPSLLSLLFIDILQAITLGNAIAEILEIPALRFLLPLVEV